MHIPDAAISPITSLAAGAAMLPVWTSAGYRVKRSLASRQVPYLAIGAAFSFTIMMFNIPAPGGTTVHPVGGTLLAVLLGPWAAVIGMTVALLIQALIFADGGILAAGANCFTMAFAMPFTGYFVYRLLTSRMPEDSPRRALAAGIGAYLGLNIAAVLTAIILGIQPALFHDDAGRALYFPFGLRVTIPAIMSAHLTIAGMAEATVTAIAVRYLQAAHIELFSERRIDRVDAGGGRVELAWIGLASVAALAPLGLLARGEVWGEWHGTELAERAGFAPSAFIAAERHGWTGLHLFPDYLADKGPWFYILAGAVGIGLIAGAAMLVGHLAAATSVCSGERDAGMDTGHDAMITAKVTSVPPSDSRVDLTWLLAPSKPKLECELQTMPRSFDTRGRTFRIRSSRYVEKTLAGFADSARELLFAEDAANKDGFLQRIDAPIKIIALLAFVVVATVLHRWPALVAMLALTTLLAVSSRIPIKYFMKRVWLPVPLFAGAFILPSILNLVAPGNAIFVISKEPYVSVTNTGLSLAVILTLRIGLAVSLVTLLTLTTRWNDLLAGLRVMLVPRILLTAASMTYRYLGVLAQTATEMFSARQSRSVGSSSFRQNHGFIGRSAGALFGKTAAFTEEVHHAMVSRCWTGEPHSLHEGRMRAADLGWLVAAAIIAAITIMGEYVGS